MANKPTAFCVNCHCDRFKLLLNFKSKTYSVSCVGCGTEFAELKE